MSSGALRRQAPVPLGLLPVTTTRLAHALTGPTSLLSPELLSVLACPLLCPTQGTSPTSCGSHAFPFAALAGALCGGIRSRGRRGHFQRKDTKPAESEGDSEAFPVALKQHDPVHFQIRAPGPPRQCCSTWACKLLKAKSFFNFPHAFVLHIRTEHLLPV